MERSISFRAAFDKSDPDPKKNYGVHGVEIRFLLKGSKGAVHFLLYTNWMLPHVQEDHDTHTIHNILSGDDFYLRKPFFLYKPMPADLGYHSPVPIHEWQEKPSQEHCEFLDGPCYYDGSTSAAERVFERLLREGDGGVWAELEDYYKDMFSEEKP